MQNNIKQRPADEREPLNARLAEDQEKDEVNDVDQDADLAGDQEEESDDTPELDEEDLEENNLSEEDADKIQWDPQKGQS